MTCPKCGKPVPAGAMYCTCGAPVVRKTVRCPKCGAINDASVAACIKCGYARSAKNAPVSNSVSASLTNTEKARNLAADIKQPVQKEMQPQNYEQIQNNSQQQYQQTVYQQTQNDTPQQNVSQQHENGNLFSYNHLSTQWSSGSSNIANYDIFNGDTQIGYVKEQGSGKKTAGGIALGALLGFNAGAHSDQLLPYEMHVLDNNGNLLSSLSRGAAMLRQKLSIRNSNGLEIAKVDSKGSKFRTMNLTISNTADIPFFTIHGKPNEMKIMDSSGTEIGTITNRSDISITGSLANDNMRSALITTAVCIDKILTAAGLWA